MIKGQLNKIVSKNNAYKSMSTEKYNSNASHNETLKTLANGIGGLTFKLKPLD